MRFVVREGRDPVAGADRVMLAAMGLPGGGIIEIGDTHVLVTPRQTTEPSALLLGPQSMTNAGLEPGAAAEGRRKVLGPASRIVVASDSLPVDAGQLVRALQGRPMTSGDRVTIDPAFLDGDEEMTLVIAEVTPPAEVVGARTRFVTEDTAAEVAAEPTA
ncbi:MAG: hypothetical protein ACE5MI_04670, partial [Acidimicrobiia bacterium]